MLPHHYYTACQHYATPVAYVGGRGAPHRGVGTPWIDCCHSLHHCSISTPYDAPHATLCLPQHSLPLTHHATFGSPAAANNTTCSPHPAAYTPALHMAPAACHIYTYRHMYKHTLSYYHLCISPHHYVALTRLARSTFTLLLTTYFTDAQHNLLARHFAARFLRCFYCAPRACLCVPVCCRAPPTRRTAPDALHAHALRTAQNTPASRFNSPASHASPPRAAGSAGRSPVTHCQSQDAKQLILSVSPVV